MDLTGCIDLHLHSAPDVRPRRLDDVDLARAAHSAGYRAILLKNHHTLTADRAAIAQRVVGRELRVFGGLALNAAVGGVNPAAVEVALAMGAKQIWFPTVSATVEHAARVREGHPPPLGAGRGPVTVFAAQGTLLPAVREVLALIRDHDAILGTGHLDRDELQAVVTEARRMGVGKVLVTHPEHPLLRLGLGEQRELAALGVMFERCFCFSVGAIPGRPVEVAAIAEAIRDVGAASSVLSTDLGRADLPHPLEGMSMFLGELARAGVPGDALSLMCRDNPARLLGL